MDRFWPRTVDNPATATTRDYRQKNARGTGDSGDRGDSGTPGASDTSVTPGGPGLGGPPVQRQWFGGRGFRGIHTCEHTGDNS